MDKRRNPERSGLAAGILLAAIGVLLMAWPAIIGLDGMDGGYAFSFMGFFLIVCGIIVFWVFSLRYRAVERIFSGDGLLARWSYDPEEAQRLAREAYDERRAHNRWLFGVVAVLMVVIGFFVLVLPMLQGEDLVWQVVLGYFLLIPIIGLVAWLAPRLEYRQALREANDVFIALRGVYVRGALHSWGEVGSSLESVVLERDLRPPELVFELSHVSSVGGMHREPEVLRIAVPEGHVQDAERVAAFFSSRAS